MYKDEDNDGKFPDESPVEVRYPRSKQEEQGNRGQWPWLPGRPIKGELYSGQSLVRRGRLPRRPPRICSSTCTCWLMPGSSGHSARRCRSARLRRRSLHPIAAIAATAWR